EFRLHPVTTVLGGMLVHPAERAREVLRRYREVTQTAPDELTLYAGLLTSPEGARIAAFVACYSGSIEEGERVLRPLREFGPPLADMIAPMPYVGQQTMLDEAYPPGLQVYWRSDFLKSLDDEVIDAIVTRFEGITSPLSQLLLEHLGGAVRRVADDATA